MESDQLVALVRRHRELTATKLEIEAEQAQIKDLIDASVDEGWSLEIDGVVANKRRGNRRFSRVLAIGLLSESEKVECVVTRYDDALLRATLEAKDLLDQAMEDVGASAQVRLS